MVGRSFDRQGPICCAPVIEIEAHITGTVWKIVVQVGDALEADDTIMILESMKMEIPVVAPEAGRVVQLLVADGAAVREGQEIAVFEES